MRQVQLKPVLSKTFTLGAFLAQEYLEALDLGTIPMWILKKLALHAYKLASAMETYWPYSVTGAVVDIDVARYIVNSLTTHFEDMNVLPSYDNLVL